LALPLSTQAQDLDPDTIAVFSREGVQVIFPDETSRHTFAEDIDSKKLQTAEMIDFSGVELGNNPQFFNWLAGFSNLRKLGLRNTKIHATPELLRTFVGMEELQKLDLSENSLFANDADQTAKLSAIWGNLPKLNELNLTKTGGTVENYGSLVLLKNLNTLHLGNNPQLCARSLLGRFTSWAGGACVKALELGKLPLAVLDLSGNDLTEDPLPDLPVASLRELSLENNGIEAVALCNLPQLEYWNLAGNPDLALADDFGSVTYLIPLQQLRYDPSATIPARLKQKFASKVKMQDVPATPSTAITLAPNPTPAPAPTQAVILKPKVDEIQAWLAGADQVKHQAALQYLQAEAKQGSKGAPHWLGQAYHKGWGLTPNWVTARNYYWQAFNAGDSTAKASLDALDREAANAITEQGNTGKTNTKSRLAQDLYLTLAKTGNKNAQGWLDWLKSKK
jgi:hypothetical protein